MDEHIKYVYLTHKDGSDNSVHEMPIDHGSEKANSNNDTSVSSGLIVSNGLKLLSEFGELYSEDKKSYTVNVMRLNLPGMEIDLRILRKAPNQNYSKQ